MQTTLHTPSLDAADPAEILVLVHPGSACGSANSNLGRLEARAARDYLSIELEQWHGGVIVIDGELSDELPSYPIFAKAISGALDRAKNRSLVSIRVQGDDPDQIEVIKQVVSQLGDAGLRAQYTVTGAWYDPEDGGGCVGSVITALTELGCRAAVAESAVSLSSDEEEEEEEDEEMNCDSGPGC